MHFSPQLTKQVCCVGWVVVVLSGPLKGGGNVKELHGDPTNGPHPTAWTKDQRSSTKDDAPERLRCGTIYLKGSELDPADVGRR